MTINTMFASYGDILLQTNRYIADNSLFVQAWNMADGPIATLTVCLEDKSLGKDEAYLDVNNFPEVVGFVEKYGLATLTGKFRRSGYCMYPAAKFNMSEVLKYAFKED